MPKILPDKSEILSRITIDPDTGCWLWLGPTDPKTHYGRIYLRTCDEDGFVNKHKSHYPVHKVAWEVWNGELPEGLELDHLCRTRRCCRPTLVTPEALATVLGWPHDSLTNYRRNPYLPQPYLTSTLITLGQHLEPVTHRENVRRSNSPPGLNSRKETCPEGHPYRERAGEDQWAWRYCPECKNARRRANTPGPDLSK